MNVAWLLAVATYAISDALAVLYLRTYDWRGLSDRYGDTRHYWDTVSLHLRLCRFMLVHPVVALVVVCMGAILLRAHLEGNHAALAIIIIGLIGIGNVVMLWRDALALGV